MYCPICQHSAIVVPSTLDFFIMTTPVENIVRQCYSCVLHQSSRSRHRSCHLKGGRLDTLGQNLRSGPDCHPHPRCEKLSVFSFWIRGNRLSILRCFRHFAIGGGCRMCICWCPDSTTNRTGFSSGPGTLGSLVKACHHTQKAYFAWIKLRDLCDLFCLFFF